MIAKSEGFFHFVAVLTSYSMMSCDGKDTDVNKIQDQRSGCLPSEGVPLDALLIVGQMPSITCSCPKQSPETSKCGKRGELLSSRFDKRGR